ncbi:hypothetical protein COCON_G00216580 [Conger conger]|uniref:Cocaine- and amphetamine-regulated transcript protein n=1 Tax=Conger conger TaxID=82655 RepID=A0A9Q1CXW0_CONCO|nr:cocaine- and amphetamine-regulated transcript protein-like [Conger conger]KAJ8252346.1 hypothetical protein COCON_G00216580 [Conger conger]
MDSSAMLLVLCVTVLSSVCSAESSRDISSEDFGGKSYTGTEKLVDAVEDLLEKLDARLPQEDKRSSIPRCNVGDRCALRLGSRIGTLCDCRRGSNCNSFLLKCI